MLTALALVFTARSSTSIDTSTTAPPLSQCGISHFNNTLGYLDSTTTRDVASSSSSACCAACLAEASCAVWSYQHMWTPMTPCHLSTTLFIKKVGNSTGNSCGQAHTPPSPIDATFTIDMSDSGKRQIFEGVEVELQSDSIGSWNTGMPKEGTLVADDDNSTLGAPHDLTPAERLRFATEALGGTRTIRLALGLYLRGLGPDNRSIIGRWPSQMKELKELQDVSGIDGWAPEYWSPPPSWKDTRSYYSGTLASFNASFLKTFCAGVVQDVRYLETNGLRVTWWGLQNEPSNAGSNTTNCTRSSSSSTRSTTNSGRGNSSAPAAAAAAAVELKSNSYSQCHYTQCDYYYAFRECAAQIKAHDASIRIHANSWSGQLAASPIAQDPTTLKLVDAWTWHTVSAPSSHTFGNTTPWAYGKADFTNEMEYQPGSPYAGTEVGTVSQVNIFLNTLVFKNSPTGVIMLHAIKPTTNLESLGYGWTWWRSTGSNASSVFPTLKEQHWTYNYWNWNAVAPFTKTVPWNSLRRNVMEDTQRVHQRVVAFETPAAEVEKGPLHAHTAPHKLIVVLTNEGEGGGDDGGASMSTTFNTTVITSDGKARTWRGYSFKGSSDGAFFNISLGAPKMADDGASFEASLPANTIQWWYEQ